MMLENLDSEESDISVHQSDSDEFFEDLGNYETKNLYDSSCFFSNGQG